MSEQSVREAFKRQSEACLALGSPFVSRLCALSAERLCFGDPVSDIMLGWQGDASAVGDSVPLRMMGALHALVRSGDAPELTAVYPPGHEEISDEELWTAISSALKTHSPFILERLKGPPQTNEVRRAAATLPLFLEVSRQTGLPLVLSEVGASAGLNLMIDRFHLQLSDKTWGDPASPVRLQPRWHGASPPNGELNILARAGCDIAPVDPGSQEDRERLVSYIWADQEERLIRTSAALEMAAKSDVRVEAVDALDWLHHRTSERHEGAAHVIYSTIAWQYLPEDARKKGRDILHSAGEKATKDAPLAWAMKEGDGASPGAGLTLTLWPGGETREVGRADYHGRWIDWRGWDDS
ncbi:MAG: DUF2332 family protein [Proteobacteria bacterium]|nr:DUF2332 family protein [Pseudomonadota bacterium]